MRKTFVVTIAAAVAVFAFASSGFAAKPAADATLTAAANPTLVKFGTYVTVAGAISDKQSGVPLTLQADAYPFDGKFEDVATASTTTDGAYTFSVLPAMNTHYRVETVDKPVIRSAEVPVGVTWAIGMGVSDKTPSKGQRVRFHGTVKPAHPNGIVYIQRKTASGWKNVKQTTMTTGTVEQSNYSVRVRIRRTGRYRATVLGDGAHETGVSRARRLVVG